MCNSCPSLPKSLQSDSRFDPRARSGSVAPVPARGVHAVPEGPPAASDGPVGIGSDLGITTCTPPTAASVAIQPRLLPGARPVSHALARAYWTTRLSINCKAARPPPALDQWADRYAQLERRHTLTRTRAPHARTHAYTHSYTNWGLNEPESQTRNRCRWGNVSEYNCTGPLTSHNLVIDLLK